MPTPMCRGASSCAGRRCAKRWTAGRPDPLKGAPAGSATVAFDARRKGVVVFGHHDALYVSYYGGAPCEVLEDGLKVPSGPERIVFLDDGRLFMFCTGNGVFTRPLPDRRW